MTKTFFISDTHFNHANVALSFTKEDGSPARTHPETGGRFSSVEEMDEYMIQQWNKVVSPKDRVYHLGDFCMPRKGLQVFHRLNGRINMVLGNHDPWKKKDWDQFRNIDQISGVRMFPKLGWVCTHIPINDRQLQGRWTHNIHGHLHTQRVLKPGAHPKRTDLFDNRYFNVSVEQIDYTPISIEELKLRLEEENV